MTKADIRILAVTEFLVIYDYTLKTPASGEVLYLFLSLRSMSYHHQNGISSSTGPSGIAVGLDCAGFCAD